MASTSTPPTPSGTLNGSRRNSILKRFGQSHISAQGSHSINDVRSEPRRVVGSVVSAVSRRLSIGRAIHRWTESDPTMAALRLTSALHEMHCNWLPNVSKVRPCTSDHLSKINSSVPVTHRLIWACNGFCSHCRTAYVPVTIDKPVHLSEEAEKAIARLVGCIRYVTHNNILSIQ
jgi:hypothetical protein